ncbi:MAG TPA: acetyl-CoA C-acetyltransferase [Vicinamibacterales bacterium]|jgi:acetyl-CoA C-acetyltransferase
MAASVIASAVRLPTGKFLGGLKGFSAPELGAMVIREAVARAGIDPGVVQDCIMGNVVSAGLGQAPARQAALRGGLEDSVSALTINKVCGSGLQAVMLADLGIRAGDMDVVVAGGMESMSNAPYLLARVREGLRMGNTQLVDSMIGDGLWCSFEQWHMGNAGEVIASECGIGRAAQDEYALGSHCKAADATVAGRFKAETLPVTIPQKKGDPIVVSEDESIRADSTLQTLSALTPAFKKDGTVTAGNAPPVNDGAAALVVMSETRARELGLAPLARIVAQASSGLAPKYVLMTPIEAIRRVLAKAGWSIDQVDLFEINEAFSVQMVAILRDLKVDSAKVNVNGGAVALGHPIGASGARILTTLLYAMRQRGAKRGIASLCLGGGNGVALAVEATH